LAPNPPKAYGYPAQYFYNPWHGTNILIAARNS
jgi:hypothetical protein